MDDGFTSFFSWRSWFRGLTHVDAISWDGCVWKRKYWRDFGPWLYPQLVYVRVCVITSGLGRGNGEARLYDQRVCMWFGNDISVDTILCEMYEVMSWSRMDNERSPVVTRRFVRYMSWILGLSSS